MTENDPKYCSITDVRMASKLSSEKADVYLPQSSFSCSRQKVALPLHVQKLQSALNLDRFIDQVEQVYNESLAMGENARCVCVYSTEAGVLM